MGRTKGTGQGPEKTPEPFSLGQGAWLILALRGFYRKVKAQVEVEGREYAASD